MTTWHTSHWSPLRVLGAGEVLLEHEGRAAVVPGGGLSLAPVVLVIPLPVKTPSQPSHHPLTLYTAPALVQARGPGGGVVGGGAALLGGAPVHGAVVAGVPRLAAGAQAQLPVH